MIKLTILLTDYIGLFPKRQEEQMLLRDSQSHLCNYLLIYSFKLKSAFDAFQLLFDA